MEGDCKVGHLVYFFLGVKAENLHENYQQFYFSRSFGELW